MNQIANRIIALLIPFVAVGVLAFTVPATGTVPQAQPTTGWMERPCPYEDSANCFWNAGTQGNGIGHSFYTHRIGNVVCIMFVGKTFAKQNDRCLGIDVATKAFADLDGDGGGAEHS